MSALTDLPKDVLRRAGPPALIAAALLFGVLSTCSPKVAVMTRVQSLGVVRVATFNSPTTYYVGATGPMGFEYDLTRAFAHDLADVIAAHLTRQSVAAEHEHVAATYLLVCEIDLDRRFGAERLQDDVLAIAQFGFFRGDFSRFDESLYQ